MNKLSLEEKEPYPIDSTTVKCTKREQGFIKKICHTISIITLEPMVMLYILAFIIATMATQNLNLDKACRVNVGFNKTTCDAVKLRNVSGYTKSQEVEVQKVVASAYTWKFVVQSTFSVIILAFVGSWSDRNQRRKACVLVPLVGEICTIICLLLCTYFFYELPMEFNIVSETIFGCLTGGLAVFMVGTFTIICSKTTMEGRTVRVGVIHILLQLGFTIGLALSGVLLYNLGYYGVYSSSLILYIFGTLYGIFFVHEERIELNVVKKNIGFLRDFFDFESLKNTFEVLFKNEDKARQKRIHLIIVIAMLSVGPMHGEMGVLYLYTRYKFHWNEVDFGIYFSFCAIVHLLAATLSLLIFSKLLKLGDELIGCIATVSKIAGSLVYAFAPNGTVFYMGVGADILSSVLFIAMRSLITKQVEATELGKMNAVFGLSEAIVPLIYGPVYSATYRATITIFPGTFYVMSSVLTLPVFGIYLWLHFNKPPKVVENREDIEKMQKLLVN